MYVPAMTRRQQRVAGTQGGAVSVWAPRLNTLTHEGQQL